MCKPKEGKYDSCALEFSARRPVIALPAPQRDSENGKERRARRAAQTQRNTFLITLAVMLHSAKCFSPVRLTRNCFYWRNGTLMLVVFEFLKTPAATKADFRYKFNDVSL